jgi:glucose/arabinose dehydrogenase
VAVGLLLATVLAACSGDSGNSASAGAGASTGASSPVGTTGGTARPVATTPAGPDGVPTSTGVPTVTVLKTLATGLRVPWGVAFLADGSALVAERPTGRIVRVGVDGGTTTVGTVPGVADRGEGGLLGLAVLPSAADLDAPVTVFAYLTSTEGDNRVVRMSYNGVQLGRPTQVLTGIPASDHHNGGLITIGPDSKLWIGTGDAGLTSRAQDRNSLGGKILRINLGGSVPSDNPFPGSPVYSLGHRNVQGLAFDSTKQPWAVEFGQNTWDELNRIVPGGNYGWPLVEGRQPRAGLIEPLVQWRTDDASPSGMAIVGDVAYIGGLRGERLWQVPLNGTTTGTPKALLYQQFGRIRTVAATPAGRLWITTSNRDGRGTPASSDDRIILLGLG